MKKIGIYINKSMRQMLRLEQFLAETPCIKGVDLFCSENQLSIMPDGIRVSEPDTELDCIFVFGGDGTILSAVDYALQSNAPILGINSGKLGFLSDFSLCDLTTYLPRLFSGNYRVFHRMLLETTVVRQRKKIYKGYALNDAVVYKGLVSRLINIRLKCSTNFVVETRCDGMIAATPTGSTAYSLSAGGPILSPDMEAIVVAALCPHVLSVRPMVFPVKEPLNFQMVTVFNETMLQLDGKNVQLLKDKDSIIVKAAKNKVSFITLTGKNFYQTLRKKLHMGKL